MSGEGRSEPYTDMKRVMPANGLPAAASKMAESEKKQRESSGCEMTGGRVHGWEYS
jgi:hypothetical protein